MDWPLIGAVSAVAIVAGAVTYEVVVFMQPDPAPVKQASQLSSYGASVDRSAYEIPGFATGKPAEWTPSFPLIRLIDPDRIPETETHNSPNLPVQAPKATQKPTAASVSPKPSIPADAATTPPTGEFKTAKLATPEVEPRAEQWRVVVTANASYFNLGGHVDKAGIVDSLASSHLRDALKSHRNFSQLPPEIRTQILTQNIDLRKLAPYRGLIGFDDKTLEEEQAVRFEKVAGNR